MTDEKRGNTEGANRDKKGAGSGVSKPSSTDGDTGNKTTQSTSKGDSIVDDKGKVTR